MIEIIDGNWAAGESKTFHINGEYVELLDAQYVCDVYLMDKSGAQLSVMKRCEASFFSKPSGGFSTIQIVSAQAQYIRFFVGSGDAGTRRISSTVQVVDGGRARTLAGATFMGPHGANAIANQFPAAQIYNPPGSGVRVVVKSYALSSSDTGYINVGRYDPAMSVFTTNGKAKMVGAPQSKAHLRGQNTAAQVIVAGAAMDFVYLTAFQTVQRKLEEPVIVLPGNGLVVEHGTSGAAVNVCWEFGEEAI